MKYSLFQEPFYLIGAFHLQIVLGWVYELIFVLDFVCRPWLLLYLSTSPWSSKSRAASKMGSFY